MRLTKQYLHVVVHKLALSPGFGAKVKLLGVEAEVMYINAQEGIEGNFAGDHNPYWEGNLSLIESEFWGAFGWSCC